MIDIKLIEAHERLFKNAEILLGRKPVMFEVPLLTFAYSIGRIDLMNELESAGLIKHET